MRQDLIVFLIAGAIGEYEYGMKQTGSFNLSRGVEKEQREKRPSSSSSAEYLNDRSDQRIHT